MTDVASGSSPSVSVTRTVHTFYQTLEDAQFDQWSSLLQDDCVYVSSMTCPAFPEERIAGRDAVVETVSDMRGMLDAITFAGLNVEPALVPHVTPIVVYVAGDCTFTRRGEVRERRSHVIHRLEILDGQVVGWIDYANPIVRALDASELTPARSAPRASAAAALPSGDGAAGVPMASVSPDA